MNIPNRTIPFSCFLNKIPSALFRCVCIKYYQHFILVGKYCVHDISQAKGVTKGSLKFSTSFESDYQMTLTNDPPSLTIYPFFFSIIMHAILLRCVVNKIFCIISNKFVPCTTNISSSIVRMSFLQPMVVSDDGP